MYFRKRWPRVAVVLAAISVGIATAQETESLPTATPLPTRIVVDEGHVEEGLWEATWKGKWSHHCEELANQRHQQQSYIEVHYNDVPRLVFSSGRRTYVFKNLLGMYYEKDESGFIWIHEQQITEASPQAISGTTFTGWLEYRKSGCHFDGTFEAVLIDTENACLVANFFDVNIRAYPSNRSAVVGTLLDARRIIGKVPGDGNKFDWWKLGEEEFVREDVVEVTPSCEHFEAGQEIELSQEHGAELEVPVAFLFTTPSSSSPVKLVCHGPAVTIIEGPAFGFYHVECDGETGFMEEQHIRILGRD